MAKTLFLFVICLNIASFCLSHSEPEPKCLEPEVYNDCGSACPETCSGNGPKICPAVCINGCFCPNGTVRDENTDKCVARGNCTCPDGETYTTCGSACPPTCQNPNPEVCTLQCVSGCYCANNTIRDENTGKCVRIDECTCPDGEIFNKCGTACPPTCSNPDPKACTYQCSPGCFCPEGTVRDENTKKCVKLDNCTCPDGEIFNECGTACPLTCSKPTVGPCTKQCARGCFCPEGTVRDENTKKCVKLDKCTCPDGEIFNECGTACPLTCSKPTVGLCTKQCAPGCFCPEGTVRDENTGKCVSPRDCTCPKGEVFDECGTACPLTCSKPTVGPCTRQCARGCFCPEGTVRDENTKKCVSPRNCTCPKGEVFDECGTACPLTCSKPRLGPCTKQCVLGCFCPEGTVRDENTGKCVSPRNCTCPKGEVFNECGTACPLTCSKPTVGPCTKQCARGCFCPEGTVRDENTGKCVSPRNCTCPKGEVFDECGTACPLTCSKPRLGACTEQCVLGCFCPEGTIRDENTGKCVDPKTCTCSENEIYTECGSACPPTCENPKPKICTLQCVKGCFCSEETIRDKETGRCVSNEECPQTEPSNCPRGEVYRHCGPDCLKTCSNPNPACNKRCKKGCFCPRGHVRDNFNNFRCIPRYQCPIP